MEHEALAVVGRQIFCLLVTLLRPIIRMAGGGIAVDLSTGRRLLPRQQGEIVLTSGSSGTRLSLTQTLTNTDEASMHASFALVLPRGAIVSGLGMGSGRPTRGAGVGPRWAVREEFEAVRLCGGSSALVSEDAPGIFSYEVAGLAPQHSVTTTLAAELGSSEPFALGRAVRLRANFCAAPTQTNAVGPRRIMHLGTSRVLDAVIGIVERRRGNGMSANRECATAPVAAANASHTTEDVFVTCERGDRASAAFRGTLADRPTRLVLDLQPIADARSAAIQAAPAILQIADLLCVYDKSQDETLRQTLVERITELGLQNRYATLWTSLLAVGDAVHDPEGERAQAVA